jgi:hypothetical protein
MSKPITQLKLALSTALFAVLATGGSAARISVSPPTLSFKTIARASMRTGRRVATLSPGFEFSNTAMNGEIRLCND